MLHAEGKPSGIRIIPPFVVLAAIVVASAIDWLWPLAFGLPTVLRWVLSAFLIAAPISVMPSVFAAFRRANSLYDVRVVPRALVTGGAFRFSRNPGYVGMIVMGVGIAILFNNPWVLVAMVPAVVIIHREVVLKEEAILQREFGEEYRQYRRRVRRWI
jgi:protein-S-isoprenylcysteine O-methyltransferase Ste14